MRDSRFAAARHRADGIRFRAQLREGQQPRRDRSLRIAGLQRQEVSEACDACLRVAPMRPDARGARTAKKPA
ncbi:hypothetical protein BVI1335_2250011 [Burkholderia vietnamiensis]|nr:hypothetical protein BVI1335_2250011 [Burkholderia vietnamiensis]